MWHLDHNHNLNHNGGQLQLLLSVEDLLRVMASGNAEGKRPWSLENT